MSTDRLVGTPVNCSAILNSGSGHIVRISLEISENEARNDRSILALEIWLTVLANLRGRCSAMNPPLSFFFRRVRPRFLSIIKNGTWDARVVSLLMACHLPERCDLLFFVSFPFSVPRVLFSSDFFPSTFVFCSTCSALGQRRKYCNKNF